MVKTKFTTSDLEDLETYKNEYGEDKIKSTLKSRGFSDTFKNIATNTIDTPNTPEIEKTEMPKVKGYEEGQVKIPGVNTISPIKIPGKTDPILKPEQLEKPDLTSVAQPQKEQIPIEQIKPNISTGTTDTGTSIQTTGISEIDDALSKLRTEKTENISETIKNYNIAKGQFEEYKGNYTNFDTVNNTFEGVLNDMQVIQETGVPLTEQDYQNIANKYGLEASDIKNPTNIFNSLQLSEEGKINTGVTDAELQIDGLTTDFNRNKEDLQDNIETQKTNLFNQLDTAQQQLEQSTQWMNAYGAWTGAGKSSGYSQGIENVKQDGEKTLNSIESLLQNVEITGQENIKRLTDDYNTAITDAKTELDSNIKELNDNAGLELNTAMLKYDKSDEQLTKALDSINEEFGTASMDVFSQYISNLRSINDYTSSATENAFNEYTLGKEMSDSRYNEYVANDGQLLQNTNLDTLIQEYSIGNITAQRFQDLQNTMITGITGILSNVAVPDEEDLTEIKQYLSNGMTPTEIIGEMAKKDKYQTIEEEEITQDWAKLDDKTLFNEKTGEFKAISGTDTGIDTGTSTGTYGDMTSIIDSKKTDDNVGKWTNNPGNIMGDTEEQQEYAKSLGAIGFYNSANGRTYAVFPDITTGNSALSSDLKTKVSGGSFWVTPDTNMIDFATGWTDGPNAKESNTNASYNMVQYLNSKGLNINDTTKISDIPTNLLAEAIQYNEGTLGEAGQDYSGYTDLGQEESDYDVDYIPYFKKATNTADLTSAELNMITEEFGSMKEFLSQATNYGKDVAKQETPNIQSYIDDLIYLRDNMSERGLSMTGIGHYDAVYDNIIAKTALNNLIDLKSQGATFGALSDNELNFIINAADTGKLKKLQNDENYEKEINKLIEKSKSLYKSVSGEEYEETSEEVNQGGNTIEDLRSDIFDNTGAGQTNQQDVLPSNGDISDQDAINYYFNNQ